MTSAILRCGAITRTEGRKDIMTFLSLQDLRLVECLYRDLNNLCHSYLFFFPVYLCNALCTPLDSDVTSWGEGGVFSGRMLETRTWRGLAEKTLV